jgi:hypothetical protein
MSIKWVLLSNPKTFLLNNNYKKLGEKDEWE